MGRKKKTLPQSAKAASSLEREPEEQMTEADRAYAHAVEVCDRIVRELDNQLPDGYRKEKS